MDNNEINKTKNLLTRLRNSEDVIQTLNDSNFIFSTDKCDLFKHTRGYNRYKIDKIEYDFPIAFIILIHNNIEQFERFLNLIYRPHNIYCIHVDLKSDKIIHDAIRSIVDCFDNVFISSKLEKIVYAGYTRLKADINCMNDLLSLKKLKIKEVKWKYLLNTASTEFPLRTNYELVRILNMYNGSNDIEIIRNVPFFRVHNEWTVDDGELRMLNTTKSPVPHGFVLAKGYAYCAFSRKIVEFVINDERAQGLLEWSKDTYSPDEHFWATIQFNNRISQSGFKDPETPRIETLARFAGWGGEYECKGTWRNGVCVFGIEDLPEIVNKKHFILNKLMLHYDPIAYECMEDWYNQRVDYQNFISLFEYCKFISTHSYIANCPKY